MEVRERFAGMWASSFMILRRRHGSDGFCLDHMSLRPLTVMDTYTIPGMDYGLYFLWDARVFSTLECKAAFREDAVAEDKRHLTASTFHFWA